MVKVCGTDDLDAPMTRGEETEGREYIMTGMVSGGSRLEREGGEETRDAHMQGGEGGRIDVEQPKTSFARIYKPTSGEVDVPKELGHDTD